MCIRDRRYTLAELGLEGDEGKIAAIMATYLAVSYTHLDVYKRQYVPYLALGLLLALALLAAFVPFKDNTFADKTVKAEIVEGGYFKQRCNQAAQTYKLSNREGEILYYLCLLYTSRCV